jgi:hypothetical protein
MAGTRDQSNMDDRDPQFKTRNSTYYSAVFFCLLIIVLSCVHQTVFDRIEQGDYSMVSKGRYDQPAMFLDQGQYQEPVLKLRRIIEKHFDLMSDITRQYYKVEDNLVFAFNYASLDTVGDKFVLRYFARTRQDPLLAGYQIFFVYDRVLKQFTRIYTSEVPLE